ncbi:hypothetical protein WH221_14365 [Chryseobacterium culicis]|uniref:Glycoside hydrolase family 15 n=1 Tax=Chryseobacterium culicis TaxID=680127 RepID=A0A2S9CS03_CHRCI|nr:hypothetical protein [Chryseobacterium culicis]PRB83291.1 hypothetical protein CQ022_14325 [Chryseobacterium culicis]PRB89533.1 hypothetical protein CQ033_13220 [Chryseobacterium culicis]
MDNLFEKWKTKIPQYDEIFKATVFEPLSKKFGAEGEKKISLGKTFSNNYELYIYAFFLGLYSDEYISINKNTKKENFSYPIMSWGSKTNISTRKDFTKIQEYIFIALMAKTDIDLIALDKGEVSEDQVIKDLITTMESYTNGGLTLIKEKLEDNPGYLINPTSYLDMIVRLKQ